MFLLSRVCPLSGRGQSDSSATEIITIVESALISSAIKIESSSSSLSLAKAQGYSKCLDGKYRATCPVSSAPAEEQSNLLMVLAIGIATVLSFTCIMVFVCWYCKHHPKVGKFRFRFAHKVKQISGHDDINDELSQTYENHQNQHGSTQLSTLSSLPALKGPKVPITEKIQDAYGFDVEDQNETGDQERNAPQTPRSTSRSVRSVGSVGYSLLSPSFPSLNSPQPSGSFPEAFASAGHHQFCAGCSAQVIFATSQFLAFCNICGLPAERAVASTPSSPLVPWSGRPKTLSSPLTSPPRARRFSPFERPRQRVAPPLFNPPPLSPPPMMALPPSRRPRTSALTTLPPTRSQLLQTPTKPRRSYGNSHSAPGKRATATRKRNLRRTKIQTTNTASSTGLQRPQVTLEPGKKLRRRKLGDLVVKSPIIAASPKEEDSSTITPSSSSACSSDSESEFDKNSSQQRFAKPPVVAMDSAKSLSSTHAQQAPARLPSEQHNVPQSFPTSVVAKSNSSTFSSSDAPSDSDAFQEKNDAPKKGIAGIPKLNLSPGNPFDSSMSSDEDDSYDVNLPVVQRPEVETEKHRSAPEATYLTNIGTTEGSWNRASGGEGVSSSSESALEKRKARKARAGQYLRVLTKHDQGSVTPVLE